MMLNCIFYKKLVIQLKDFLGFFELFNGCTIYSIVLKTNHFPILDIGFKYMISLKKFLTSLDSDIALKILELKTKRLNIIWVNLNFYLNLKSIYYILKKAFKEKYILLGRILNAKKYYFSVGILGVICKLSKKNAVLNHVGVKSLFIIKKYKNFSKGIVFFISQSYIVRWISRILLKLFSTVSYISKKSYKRKKSPSLYI